VNSVSTRLPRYSIAGLAVLALSEAGMLLHIEPFRTFHTPIAWTGYILLVDGIVFSRRRSSWLVSNRREFFFLAAVSIPLWLVFEAYNLLIGNWHYVGLQENPVAREIGYAWAFATISPGIFETAEAVDAIVNAQATISKRSASTIGARRWSMNDRRWLIGSILLGAGLLTWPIIRPSPYLAPAVWLGFILLLDPLNYLLGAESLIGDVAGGQAGARRMVNLSIAGFVCGVIWEFWNYWAGAKWIYTVPYLPNVKIFEMPILGYFGFPPFALECFTMYVFVRQLLWRGAKRPVAIPATSA